MKSPGKVIIVGGGVIGAASAHYLNLRGWQVTIVERGEFGMGCSHANCGYISPSHVLPLAEPGAVKKTLKLMLQKNAPIYVKPRIDLALWKWLWNFSRRCKKEPMLEAGHAMKALLFSSRELYDALIRDDGLACEYQTIGCLFAYQSAEPFEKFAKTDKLLREVYDVPAQQLDGAALAKMEPALKANLAGAWYYPIDAHLRPDRLMTSWQKLLTERGVKIRERETVTDFVREGSRCRAIKTNNGEMEADEFVVATGAWTPMLNEKLGARVPIQPGKGYSITMARPRNCPTYPMIFPEHKVAVTPFASGYRLGSTMEFSGYDESLNPKRLNALREGAAVYLHEPYCDPVEEEWYGWRPMTYDGLPLIGPTPAMSNLLIAAGHNMIGLSMAPATGKLVAEMLSHETPHVDPQPYAVTRF